MSANRFRSEVLRRFPAAIFTHEDDRTIAVVGGIRLISCTLSDVVTVCWGDGHVACVRW